MEKFCKVCAADPTSHSFKKVAEKGGVSIYYSHPAQSKLHDDTDGILTHIDKMLASNGQKPWRCIINGDGYDLKLTLQRAMGGKLVDLLLEKYNKNLKDIIIINPGIYVRAIIKVVSTMFDAQTFSKIKVLDDRAYSILEFI
jgi:hypothetical protein